MNIFLTGEINVGKSYILNKYIKDMGKSVSGFKTLAKYHDNRLEGYIIKDELEESKASKDNFVGVNEEYMGKKKCRGLGETFDTIGVEILDNALCSQTEYILMDELGFFENEAYIFQDKVHQILDSERIVMGVIKKRDNPFLKKVRERDDVEVMEITLENREEMYKLFVDKMEEVK